MKDKLNLAAKLRQHTELREYRKVKAKCYKRAQDGFDNLRLWSLDQDTANLLTLEGVIVSETKLVGYPKYLLSWGENVL